MSSLFSPSVVLSITTELTTATLAEEAKKLTTMEEKIDELLQNRHTETSTFQIVTNPSILITTRSNFQNKQQSVNEIQDNSQMKNSKSEQYKSLASKPPEKNINLNALSTKNLPNIPIHSLGISDPPINVQAVAISASNIMISWDEPPDTGDSPIIRYDLERKTDLTSFQGRASTTSLSLVDTTLMSGTKYYYRIQAVNSAGKSLDSAIVHATTFGVPDAPTLLAITTTSTTITIAWSPSSDGGTPITSYTVERSSNDSFNSFVSFPGNTGYTLTDSGLDKGSTYYYRVRAINSVGSSTASSIKALTTLATVPGAPTDVNVEISGAYLLTVSWKASSDTGGTPITSYTVERSDGNPSSFIPLTPSVSTTTFTDSGLTGGTVYYYRVKANNAQGPSAASAYALEVAVTYPDAPSGLMVLASGTTISVSWIASANTGGLSITYILSRSEAGAEFTNITTSTTTYPDSGLKKGLTYSYKVLANNSLGESAFTLPQSETIDTTVPGIPTGLTATASGTTITVNWVAPTDTGGLTISYILSRSEDGGSFMNITTNAPTYTDSGLNKNFTYIYKVLSNNSLGESIFTDPVSEIVPATVPGIPVAFTLSSANATVVELSWNAPFDTGGLSLSYTIERSTDSGVTFDSLVADIITTSFNDTTIVKGMTYSYRVLAGNSVGSSAPSSAQVVEIESTAPNAIAPNNETLELGLTTLLNWTATDTNPTIYNITRNGMGVRGNTVWASGNVVNYTTSNTLAVGVYNFTAYFIDAFDNVATSSVQVIIEDTTTPNIKNPVNATIELNTETTLTWNSTDLNPRTYNITRNGETVATGLTWSSENVINYTTSDTLTVGVYNFTAYFVDGSNNVATSSVQVIIEDTTIPNVVNPLNITIEFKTGITLTWNPTDLSPGMYNITQNGEAVVTGLTWSSEDVVNYTTSDTLNVGIYNFIAYFVDAYNNVATSPVQVIIEDSTIPNITHL